jgi:hypothetical protein
VRGFKLAGHARWIGTKLQPYATLATYILAVVGAIGLANPLLTFIFNKLNPPDIMGAARPVCEAFPFSTKGVVDPKGPKLMGAQIRALKTISQLRLSMNGILEVNWWGMQSSGLSVAEQEEFLSRLPTGPVVAPIVTPALPTLLAGTDTHLVAIVLPLKDRCIDGLWLDTLLPEGKVYVTDPSDQVYRDLNYVADLGSPWRFGLIAFIVGVMILAFRYRRAVVRASRPH